MQQLYTSNQSYSFLTWIIPEPSFPSQGSQARGTRLKPSAFSYPEPFLRAVNRARRGALAKSISNWHLIGYNEGYCSNNVYILLPCFYGIRFWIWPEPLVVPRVRRALGTRMLKELLDVSSSPFLLFLYARLTHSRTQSPSYARSTERDEGLWPNPYQTGIWLATTKVIVLITYISFTMFLWFPVLDLARAPRRTARKKGSGYENAVNTKLASLWATKFLLQIYMELTAVHQYGRHFIVLVHQYGRRDVRWKRSIRFYNGVNIFNMCMHIKGLKVDQHLALIFLILIFRFT